MGRRTTKGTRQLAAEVDEALYEEFRAFVRDRGESVREHLELAIRRHLDNPPPPLKPPPAPPLPPLPGGAGPTAEPPAKGKRAGGKGEGREVTG